MMPGMIQPGISPSGSGGSNSGDSFWGGGMGPALIGAGGSIVSSLIPTSSSQTQNTAGNTNTDTTYNTGQNIDMTTLMSMIQDLVQSQSQTSSSQTTGSVTPTLSPEATAMMNSLMQKFGGMTTPSLTGYGAYQTGQINANADAQSQAVNNVMAARGLSTSPAAATAAANIDQNRINQVTQMQQQLPLLQNQLNLANLGAATNFFATIPRGQTSTGTTTGQTQTDSRQIGTTTQNQNQSGTVDQSGHTNVQIGSQGVSNTRGSTGLSDERLKHTIRNLTQAKAIEKIRELKARTWKWKESDSKDVGVVAQEAMKVIPESVSNVIGDLKAVDYASFIPYLIGAVQNIDSRLEEVEV
jgi:hypothetical protein